MKKWLLKECARLSLICFFLRFQIRVNFFLILLLGQRCLHKNAILFHRWLLLCRKLNSLWISLGSHLFNVVFFEVIWQLLLGRYLLLRKCFFHKVQKIALIYFVLLRLVLFSFSQKETSFGQSALIVAQSETSLVKFSCFALQGRSCFSLDTLFHLTDFYLLHFWRIFGRFCKTSFKLRWLCGGLISSNVGRFGGV